MGNEQGNTKTSSQSRNHQHHGTTSLPSNARLMNTAIKQRLQKGNAKSTYNMKVVIRGDRQTGKSALFHRLEGGGFIKEHRVTEQMQCSHVLWPYKTSDEMVNLEIWDVVDKAIIPSNIVEDNNGIVPPSIVSKNLLPADATTIDVYKGAHAIIFMVDPTRKWTLDYVKNNISQIPDGIDCVLLFGKKDLNKLWTLTNGEIEEFMASQPQNVRSLQISLQDCYGMKELHSFFNVPFLRMKAKYLQQELTRAEREWKQSKVELDIFINHQNYDEFLDRLRALKEQKNRKLKPPSSPQMAPALKVKQTVRSSKDLPLIQEQQQKEELKKKQQEEKTKQQLKKLENIETFKPIGGLNDDFFADLVGDDHNNDDSKDDDDHNDKDKDKKIIQKEGIEINGYNKKEMNDDKMDINNSNEIGFNDDELNNDDETNNKSKSLSNGHDNDNKKQEEGGLNMAYSRMPDLKINPLKQRLMKVTAEVDESESDEYDDEPLVFATPKEIKKKEIIKPKINTKITTIKQTVKTKESENNTLDDSMKMEPINLSEMVDTKDTTKDTKDTENALDSFLNDLNTSKSPKSPRSPRSPRSNDDDDDNELDQDEAAKRRRKEEKRRRRKEKKKRKKEKKKKKHHKHQSDSEDIDSSNNDENSKKKKKKKKKKKTKKKHKEKDNDVVEFDDSESDDIVEIE